MNPTGTSACRSLLLVAVSISFLACSADEPADVTTTGPQSTIVVDAAVRGANTLELAALRVAVERAAQDMGHDLSRLWIQRNPVPGRNTDLLRERGLDPGEVLARLAADLEVRTLSRDRAVTCDSSREYGQCELTFDGAFYLPLLAEFSEANGTAKVVVVVMAKGLRKIDHQRIMQLVLTPDGWDVTSVLIGYT